jgi:hypothetical protein
MLLTIIVVGVPASPVKEVGEIKSAMLALQDGTLQLAHSSGTLTEQEAANLMRPYLEDFLRTHPRTISDKHKFSGPSIYQSCPACGTPLVASNPIGSLVKAHNA